MQNDKVHLVEYYDKIRYISDEHGNTIKLNNEDYNGLVKRLTKDKK